MNGRIKRQKKVEVQFLKALWLQRELSMRLTMREVNSRYKGSALGIAWSFITPMAMLAVYTFVFSQVFKARWGGLENTGSLGFAVNLFAGLIVFTFFSECATKAPGLVTSNPNYVKKVIFPLEVLGSSLVGSAAFHATISLAILLVFEIAAFKAIPWTLLLLPIVWTPLFIGTLALTWLVSATGVFIRDVGQIVGVLVNMIMFVSPIFFPISALPQRWQPILSLNPIAQVIEQTRMVAIKGEVPNPLVIVLYIIISILVCEASFRLFKKSKGAFADVI